MRGSNTSSSDSLTFLAFATIVVVLLKRWNLLEKNKRPNTQNRCRSHFLLSKTSDLEWTAKFNLAMPIFCFGANVDSFKMIIYARIKQWIQTRNEQSNHEEIQFFQCKRGENAEVSCRPFVFPKGGLLRRLANHVASIMIPQNKKFCANNIVFTMWFQSSQHANEENHNSPDVQYRHAIEAKLKDRTERWDWETYARTRILG